MMIRHLRFSGLLAVASINILFGLLLSAGFNSHFVHAQSAPTLPPTWTPAPTWTPEPTLEQPTFDATGPTDIPLPTLKPVPIEQAQLYAPLFFLTKRHTTNVYLARTDPSSNDSTTVVQVKGDVLAFGIAPDGKLAYSTDGGIVAAAGRAKVWHTPLANKNPLRAYDFRWSPDSSTLAFSVRATDKDFAATAKAPVSGVYLWSATGNPTLIAPDVAAATGTGRTEYHADSWSPDGKYLLVSFADQPSAATGSGWIVYDVTNKTTTKLIRFTPGSLASFQSAIWLPDSNGLALFNQRATATTVANGAAVLSLTGAQQGITLTGDGIPSVVSTLAFLPDGHLLVLGSDARDQPLRLFLGSLNATNAIVRPISNAFKLKWPGTLLLSPTGFPAYVFDTQYGVVIFKDERIFAFDPVSLAISATDNLFTDPSVNPGWQFSASTIALPSAS
jgi:WD40 repeat protein